MISSLKPVWMLGFFLFIPKAYGDCQAFTEHFGRHLRFLEMIEKDWQELGESKRIQDIKTDRTLFTELYRQMGEGDAVYIGRELSDALIKVQYESPYTLRRHLAEGFFDFIARSLPRGARVHLDFSPERIRNLIDLYQSGSAAEMQYAYILLKLAQVEVPLHEYLVQKGELSEARALEVMEKKSGDSAELMVIMAHWISSGQVKTISDMTLARIAEYALSTKDFYEPAQEVLMAYARSTGKVVLPLRFLSQLESFARVTKATSDSEGEPGVVVMGTLPGAEARFYIKNSWVPFFRVLNLLQPQVTWLNDAGQVVDAGVAFLRLENAIKRIRRFPELSDSGAQLARVKGFLRPR